MKKRFLSIMLMVAMIATMSSFAVFAADNSGVAAKVAAKAELNDMYADENEEVVKLTSPGAFGTVTRYIGESLTVKCNVKSIWWDKGYYTVPAPLIFNDANDKVYEMTLINGDLVEEGAADWTFKKTLGSAFPAGKYFVLVSTAPVNEDGDTPTDEELTNDYDEPFVFFDLVVKRLAKPTNLKATAGSRKVTVSWKGTTAASKYQVYRSLKKSSGYKLVKTTTSKSFTDKGVKKGKRYYYKVRAVRAKGYGTAYSLYTTPKLTAKVK